MFMWACTRSGSCKLCTWKWDYMPPVDSKWHKNGCPGWIDWLTGELISFTFEDVSSNNTYFHSDWPQIEAIYRQRGHWQVKQQPQEPRLILFCTTGTLLFVFCNKRSSVIACPRHNRVSLFSARLSVLERALPRTSIHAWKQTLTRKNEISGSFKRKYMNYIPQPRFLNKKQSNQAGRA